MVVVDVEPEDERPMYPARAFKMPECRPQQLV
jgi:hypothetical protein